jgi:hypothetical protein
LVGAGAEPVEIAAAASPPAPSVAAVPMVA